MNLSDFYYDLPKELIAQDPIEKRDNSKLLIIDKKTNELIHKHFFDIVDYLNEEDVLVINDTKVIPARLIGEINNKNTVCEIFLIKRINEITWECLVRPGKKLKIGTVVNFLNNKLTAKITNIYEDGNREVQFTYEGIFEEILDELGETPLPPYITHRLEDKNRYQTVYAKNPGSVAAPTAGLHFTNELLDRIRKKNVMIANVTLHVSLGTFRPVKCENILEHKMHSELAMIDKKNAEIINNAKKNNKKIFCVGTTSCRTVESFSYYDNIKKCFQVNDGIKETNIFIYPGYKFKILDALITNFHLPESTLIMLVSALAGREKILNAYKEAIKNNYRFFSFGDACLII